MVIKDDRPRKSGLPEIKNKVLVFFSVGPYPVVSSNLELG